MWSRTTPSPLTDQNMTRPEPARAPGPRMRRPHHAVDSDHRSDERSWSVLAEESGETEHQLLLHDRNPQQPVPMAQHFRAEQFIADLSAPAKTQHLAAEVTARHQQRLAVDHPSPVLFTWQLLPLLRADSPSRSANIASVVQEPMESKRNITIWSGP